MTARPLRVTHVITGLSTGGAEMALLRLLAANDPARVRPSVVSLTGDGAVGEQIRALDIPVSILGFRRRVSSLAALPKLVAVLRRQHPDVVQTWMYHADLVGGLAARAARVPGVAWGIRQGDLLPATTRLSTRAVARICAALSRRVPDAIVCCSASAAEAHAAVGYASQRMVVIPNGLPVPALAADVRAAGRHTLGLGQDALVAARVGRWHPHKDYPLLLRAFADVAAHEPRAVLVAVGPGVVAHAAEPARLLAELGLRDRVRFLGERTDVTSVLAASDIVVSSSNGEGFPNTVAEAMAVGVPAVVTDVGSSADLVAATGWVVPPADVFALAVALLSALQASPDERKHRGTAARERIRSEYGAERMAGRYATLHERLGGVAQTME